MASGRRRWRLTTLLDTSHTVPAAGLVCFNNENDDFTVFSMIFLIHVHRGNCIASDFEKSISLCAVSAMPCSTDDSCGFINCSFKYSLAYQELCAI